MSQLGFQFLSQHPWPTNTLSSLSWDSGFFVLSPEAEISFEDTFYNILLSPDYPGDFRHFPLWKDACKSSDSVHYDCYSLCTEHAFDSRFHLGNCASIALLVETQAAREFYNVTNPSDVPVVTGDDQVEAQRIVTQDLETTAENTSRNIWQCLVDKCQDLPDCKGSLSSYDTNTSYPAKLRGNATDLVNDLCRSISLQLDSDIGGIGVYISYWIHSCSILFLFIISLLFKGIAQYFLRWNAKGSRLKIGEFADRRLTTLNSTLVEFHKAQCFFTIAINIAAIKIFKRGGLNPESLEQLYINYIFSKIVAISGYLPVTLTLLNLHIIHKTDWFLVFLSAASTAFAAGTLGVLGVYFVPTKKDLKALEDFSKTGGPDSCQNTQPWAYCYTDTYTQNLARDLNTMGNGILGFCIVIMLLLIIGKLKNNHPSFRRYLISIWRRTAPARTMIGNISLIQRVTTPCRNTWARATAYIFRHPNQRYGPANGSPFSFVAASPTNKFSSITYSTRERIHRRADRVGHSYLVYQIFKVLIYCLFVGFFGYFFSVYLKALKIFANKQAYKDTWSFGQVVALLVWVPPIVEYIHCEIRGMQGAFDHRLLPPYHVTTQETDDWLSNQDANNQVKYGRTEYPRSGGKPPNMEVISSSIPLTAAASPPANARRMNDFGRSWFASEGTPAVMFDGHDSDRDEEEGRDLAQNGGGQMHEWLQLDSNTEYRGAGTF